jgi:hypothetical protein
MYKYSRGIKWRRRYKKGKGEERKNNSQSAAAGHLSSKGMFLQVIVI